MDVNCLTCGEPWDVLGIIDDELENDFSQVDSFGDLNKNGFWLNFYLGAEECEHFFINRCPCCPKGDKSILKDYITNERI